jgi:hypothetical protein
MTYTFVTVSHYEDFEVLRLQARSLQLYLPRDLLSEIIVVENPTPGRLTDWGRERLLREYGELGSYVRFLEAKEIADITMVKRGWDSQQILKLMVSRFVNTDRYIVLDAKNHLIYPLERSFLESGNKICSYLSNYEGHNLRKYFERAASYFNLDCRERIKAFLPTITPFTFPTQVVRDLIDHVASREQKPFPAAFVENGLSEFFLFGWYLCALEGNFQNYYDFTGVACPAIWKETFDLGPRIIFDLITHATRNKLPFFSIHRWAFPLFNDENRAAIADFWCRRGLFASFREALDYLRNPHRL